MLNLCIIGDSNKFYNVSCCFTIVSHRLIYVFEMVIELVLGSGIFDIALLKKNFIIGRIKLIQQCSKYTYTNIPIILIQFEMVSIANRLIRRQLKI